MLYSLLPSYLLPHGDSAFTSAAVYLRRLLVQVGSCLEGGSRARKAVAEIALPGIEFGQPHVRPIL